MLSNKEIIDPRETKSLAIEKHRVHIKTEPGHFSALQGK
jgi:hypothetical protein